MPAAVDSKIEGVDGTAVTTGLLFASTTGTDADGITFFVQLNTINTIIEKLARYFIIYIF
jgi:hypothetical protein